MPILSQAFFGNSVRVWAFALTTLGVSLGIGGIVGVRALKNILGDLLSAMWIMLDRPFEVGDFITVGGSLGVVEHFGMKTTRIRSLSGAQILFSNSNLLKSRVRNDKRMMGRRVVLTLRVPFGGPVPKMEVFPALLREIVTGQAGVRLYRAHFREIEEAALCFEIVFFVLDPDYNHCKDVQQAIEFKIMARFDAGGIGFASTVPVQGVATPDTTFDLGRDLAGRGKGD